MKSKRYFIVDEDTGEVVDETNLSRHTASRFFASLFGGIVGVVAFYVAYQLGYTVISIIGKIPILGNMLYWPSDSSWALICIPGPLGVACGAFACKKTCKSASPFCIAVALVYLLAFILVIKAEALSFTNAAIVLFIVGAAACGVGDNLDSKRSVIISILVAVIVFGLWICGLVVLTSFA